MTWREFSASCNEALPRIVIEAIICDGQTFQWALSSVDAIANPLATVDITAPKEQALQGSSEQI